MFEASPAPAWKGRPEAEAAPVSAAQLPTASNINNAFRKPHTIAHTRKIPTGTNTEPLRRNLANRAGGAVEKGLSERGRGKNTFFEGEKVGGSTCTGHSRQRLICTSNIAAWQCRTPLETCIPGQSEIFVRLIFRHRLSDFCCFFFCRSIWGSWAIDRLMTGDLPQAFCVQCLNGRDAAIVLFDGSQAAQLGGTKAPPPPIPNKSLPGVSPCPRPQKGGGGVAILRRIWSEVLVT